MTSFHRSPARGFTLIEAVVVITITAIVAGMVSIFIRVPVLNYIGSAARAELTDTADLAMRRLARDVRLALPNSIRTSIDAAGNQYLELLLTKTGGRYLAENEGNAVGLPPLSFTDPIRTTFNVLGRPLGNLPAKQAIVPGDYIVVYNLGPGLAPADAYADGDPCANCNRGTVEAVTGDNIKMTSNPFAAQTPTLESPGKRFQVVSTPVTYVWNKSAKTITRYWNYAIRSNQPDSAAEIAALSTKALLAQKVSNCVFSYDTLLGGSSALLSIRLVLTDPAGAGNVELFQQVHVDNTP
jgi:MSHA biogenesis protein MshO